MPFVQNTINTTINASTNNIAMIKLKYIQNGVDFIAKNEDATKKMIEHNPSIANKNILKFIFPK